MKKSANVVTIILLLHPHTHTPRTLLQYGQILRSLYPIRSGTFRDCSFRERVGIVEGRGEGEVNPRSSCLSEGSRANACGSRACELRRVSWATVTCQPQMGGRVVRGPCMYRVPTGVQQKRDDEFERSKRSEFAGAFSRNSRIQRIRE